MNTKQSILAAIVFLIICFVGWKAFDAFKPEAEAPGFRQTLHEVDVQYKKDAATFGW